MKTVATNPHGGPLQIIFLIAFIDMLGFGMVRPLLALYARDFGAADNGLLIGLLAAGFSATQFLVSPLWGRLSDRIGRRPVLMAGLAGSAVCYGLLGSAAECRSLGWLLVARAGAGIFGATTTTAQAYVADVTSFQTRAKGMALIGIAYGLGFTLGPLLDMLALLGNTSHSAAVPGYSAWRFRPAPYFWRTSSSLNRAGPLKSIRVCWTSRQCGPRRANHRSSCCCSVRFSAFWRSRLSKRPYRCC